MPIRATWVVGKRPKPNFNYYGYLPLQEAPTIWYCQRFNSQWHCRKSLFHHCHRYRCLHHRR